MNTLKGAEIKLSDLNIHFPPRKFINHRVTPQAVCMTHKPTGIRVCSSDKRSVYTNRAECYRLLHIAIADENKQMVLI